MAIKDLAIKYNPNEVEEKWYAYWQEHRLFASEPDDRPSYTIVIPPPNVTGVLHMGHMLNNTIQDILIRRARMTGFNACWVPGTDHASIATEAKVVAKLAKEGIQKSDLTREEFLTHVWDWTREHGGIIIEQLKKLGASCDWERTAFTMDDLRSESVINVFCYLYRKGLIYRGVRMVNWDPKAKTAISDEEVIYKEAHGKLYYVRYYLEGDLDKYIIVATTRPETIFGDTAVCINPNDERYQWLKGCRVVVPGVGRIIPIIEDEYVDMIFGTGCLKVTPSHDINDYMLGQKHNLPELDIFNDDGTLNELGGKYQGADRFEVRDTFSQELTELGLMERIEDYVNNVGCSERTDVPIEPKLSMQWFLKMSDLSKPAYEAVMSDTIRLIPSKYKSIYARWMENIKDWNISRQLYWGHRIPAYYLPNGAIVVGENSVIALEEAQKQFPDESYTIEDLVQDSDTLDTWFSSWLWPISVFADPTKTEASEELKYYYPTATLVSGPDILFFWIARMVMAGYEFLGDKPFSDVFLTGIVRDSLGRKMSKQLGNSPDPIELMKLYGADGVRMGLMTAASAGNDILFDEKLCEQGRNFNNKIWNSFRLIQGWETDNNIVPDKAQSQAIVWMEELLKETASMLDEHFSKFRISDAMVLLYKVFRDDFSGTYLELIKPPFGEKISTQVFERTNAYLETLLKLLHPFMPFITEELWQAMASRMSGESIMYAQIEDAGSADKALLERFELLREIITSVRSIRAKHSISPKNSLKLYSKELEITEGELAVIQKLANVSDFELNDLSDNAISVFTIGIHQFGVPVEQHLDKDAEIAKLQKEIEYYTKFISSVQKKLANDKFVANAPEAVVALERQKELDATEKLSNARTRLESLQ